MARVRWRAYAGAGLAVALAIAGLGQVSKAIFEPRKPERPFPGEFDIVCGGCGDEEEDAPPDWGAALATADVAAGEAVFVKCRSCHTLDPAAEPGTGPHLKGVVGRKPGSLGGYAYSDAMVMFGAEAANWDEARLYAFLRGPQKYVPGTKMTFAGLRKREDRINLIAYLQREAE